MNRYLPICSLIKLLSHSKFGLTTIDMADKIMMIIFVLLAVAIVTGFPLDTHTRSLKTWPTDQKFDGSQSQINSSSLSFGYSIGTFFIILIIHIVMP